MPPINLYMEDFFHIQEGTAGVVSICNNWKGTELNLLTKDKRLCDIPGRVGDTINVDIHTVDSFSISHLPASEETDSAPSNFVVTINERTTHVPFANGDGSASLITVTMHNGKTTIIAGTIVTNPKEIPTDYINEELQPGDKVCVRIG